MTEIIISDFQFKRGPKANMPALKYGEPYICDDSGEMAIGKSDGGAHLITLGALKTSELSRLGVSQDGNLVIDDVEFAAGSGARGPAGKSAFELWLDEGNIGTLQDFLASLKGAKGDVGAQGLQGIPGVKGDTGVPGPQGIQGVKGDTGAQGIQGLKGDKGDAGADGKSSYQTWLDAGNTGTVSDFLLSLKGEKGDTGAQGLQGVQGIQGPAGAPGASDGVGILIYQTLAELQTAYPSGVSTPVWVVNDNAWYYWSSATTPTDITAPTVTMSPAAGLYNTSKSVTLTANETATIYYTTDGSTPTTSSTVYSAPISISATTTLKYFAKDTAGNSSTPQTAVFTIDTVLPVLTITAGGTFTGTKSVTMSTDETADIYYTIDGSTPTTSSMKYTSALSITATTTLKAFAKDTAGNQSAVQTVTYTLDAPADTTAPTVTASPAAGTYTSAQSVTLTANETATIYYTTNGTTPTTASTVYTGPISISATTTLQFIGKDTAGNTSTPVAATYTINIPDTTAPVLTITPAATFTDTQTVTMSATDASSYTIWYTVDGSDPTTSGTKVQYSTPVTLTATTTVKAYAVDSANNASAVQTVTYTKQAAAAWVTNGLVRKWDSLTAQTSVTNDGSYYPATSEWTVVATVKPKAYLNLLSQYTIGSANSTVRIFLDSTGQKVALNTWGSGGATFSNLAPSTAILTDSSIYYHIAIMRDNTANSWKIYVNDVSYGTGGIPTPYSLNSNNTELIKIGDASSDIKTIAYYNRLLTSAELTQNYNALK